MSRLEQLIAELAAKGVRITLWPCAGGYQANVAEQGGNGWTCHTEADPLVALVEALRLRSNGVAAREVRHNPEPTQIDLEDAIAAADDFESLM